MNTIEIRLAKKEDAQCIALLGRITFTETFRHFFRDQKDLIDYYNLTFSVKKLKMELRNQTTFSTIAFVNRLPVGYAKLNYIPIQNLLNQRTFANFRKSIF